MDAFHRLAALFLSCALLCVLAGCKSGPRLSAEEEEVLNRATQIAVGINAYHNTNGTVPEEISEVAALLADMVTWPVNVFTGEPMVDTRDKEFHADSSPGNVFFNKIYREDQIVMWELHAFGEKQTIKVFSALDAAALERKRKP